MIAGCMFIPLSIYDDNAIVHPFKDNNNHKILLWYSWYNAHHTSDGKETTDTIIDLLYAQNNENYLYTIQEINTIIYFKLSLK